MKNLISNKYFLWFVIMALGGIGGYALGHSISNKALETYNRQLQGQLTEKERELQALNTELGLSRSELMTQEELAKKLAKDNEEYDKKFAAFVKKHNLEVASRDKTIAELKQLIEGGETDVIVRDCAELSANCVIKYTWQDFFNRFKLVDPNIFEKNNELFESSQVFKVYGEVYQQREGSLQTRRLVLRELYKKADGSYGEVPGAKAEIVDSEFQYINPPRLEDLDSSLFRLRLIALGSIFVHPNPGSTRLGIGVEFLNFKGFGLNTHTSFDFSEDISQHLGLSYNPRLFGEPLNLAAGISYGTPFNKFFKEFSLSFNVLFYITN